MPYSAIPRGDVSHDILVWFIARDRDTGTEVPYGFWTGAEDVQFFVDGQYRSFYGDGAITEIEPMQAETGVSVTVQRLRLSPIHPQVRNMLRIHDARHAVCRVYVLRRDPLTNAVIGVDRAFKGRLNNAPIIEGALDGEAVVEAELVSSARSLTKSLPLTKSHAAQQQRGGDMGMQYASISGVVAVVWGMQDLGVVATPTLPPPPPPPQDDPDWPTYPGR